MSPDLSPQLKWEAVKSTTKQIIKSFGTKYVSWRTLTLRELGRKRNRLLRSKPPVSILQLTLPKIDRMIYILQQELVDVAALKANAIWRENSERSLGHLKSVHRQRTAQQYMASLQSPTTPTSTTTDSSITSDPTSMRIYAQQYYQTLYSIDAEFLDSEIFLDKLIA
ncbi:hypothetical protein EDC94DRAFT_330536 [Helicostylum pulchrum]|nr:hypothetical protein EDC94DRAFT_330536 [Helicostylum pulchrum]